MCCFILQFLLLLPAVIVMGVYSLVKIEGAGYVEKTTVIMVIVSITFLTFLITLINSC